MRVCHPTVLAFSIPVLLAAYAVLEFRLHDEYRDYRIHRPLGCMDCPAVSTEVSHQYGMQDRWDSAGISQASSVPLWLRQVNRQLNPRSGILGGDRECRHAMTTFTMPQGKDDVVFSDLAVYLLPEKFHRIKRCASLLLMFFPVAVLVHLACHWACGWVRRRPRTCALTTAWIWLFASLAVLGASLQFPVGTPVTRMLRECRDMAFLLDGRSSENADWRRVEYLLSDEAIRDCEISHIGFRLPDAKGKEGNPDDTGRFLFPSNYLRRAQIQLAVAVAPHDIFLANLFFYGTRAEVGNDWLVLAELLDQRLVKRNSAYKDWAMGYPAFWWDRAAATVAASMRYELRVKSASTNRCGTVNIIWCGMELPDVEYLTIYGKVQQENHACWVPLRTAVCPDHFPLGYPWRQNIVMTW